MKLIIGIILKLNDLSIVDSVPKILKRTWFEVGLEYDLNWFELKQKQSQIQKNLE